MSHVYCTECGFQNPEAANYCSRCGALLEKGDAAAESTQSFSAEEIGELANDPDAPLGDIIVRLLEWTDRHRAASLVFFVRSPGWSQSIEALRREVRLEMLNLFSAELRIRNGITARAKQAAAATAMSSLLEVSASSWLTEDVVLPNLGRCKFSDEVRELAADIGSV